MFKSAQFNVFKGKAALRISLIPPREDYGMGFLYAEVANENGKNASGNRIYDWENKIPIKLGIVDISKLAYAIERGQSCELFHQFDGATKGINLQRAEGGQSPYFFSVSQKNKEGQTSKISVPLASEEVYSILTLLKHSIPAIHGW